MPWKSLGDPKTINLQIAGKLARQEIRDQLLSKITDINDLKQNKDRIVVSGCWRLDSKWVDASNAWEVTVRYVMGDPAGSTYAVILLEKTAILLYDAKFALDMSASVRHVYRVT